MINPKTGNNYFEVADLEPDVYFAIDALKVGEISKPVGSNDQEGKSISGSLNYNPGPIPIKQAWKPIILKFKLLQKN